MKAKVVNYACAVLLFFVTTVSAQQHTLTLGVVPQQSAKKLAEIWQPLIDYIEEFTGLQIIFKTAKELNIAASTVSRLELCCSLSLIQ